MLEELQREVPAARQRQVRPKGLTAEFRIHQVGAGELLVGFEQERSKGATCTQPCFRKGHLVPRVFMATRIRKNTCLGE